LKINFFYITLLSITLFFSCDNQISLNDNNFEEESPIYYKRSISKDNSIYQGQIDTQIKLLKSIQNNNLENNQVLGCWFGEVNNSWITLAITNVNNTMVSGFIIQDTLFKNFKGWYSSNNNILYKLGITDEGGNKMNYYDLNLSLEKMIINGTSTLVTSNNQDVKSNNVLLSKRSMKYNLTYGQYPEFSQRKIEMGEFQDLSRMDLIYICKEILAKHGLIFFDENSRNLFSNTKWYTPSNFKVGHLLSDIEKNNLNNIYSFLSR
jgi:hypothetical protein